jgi:hypothetical protein
LPGTDIGKKPPRQRCTRGETISAACASQVEYWLATLQAGYKAVWRIDDAGPTSDLLLTLALEHAGIVQEG